MIRALLLGLGALVAWRFLARRSAPDEVVTVGWDDGSAIELEPGSPERDALAEIARGAVG
jgi:hypothetical protein